MSSLNIFQNLVYIHAFFLKGWNIPGAPVKAIMSGRGEVPKYTYVKVGQVRRGGKIINFPGVEIIFWKVRPPR